MRVAFHGWPGNDETIDTVMFDPNQKPDTARAENSIFGSPEADNLLPKDEFRIMRCARRTLSNWCPMN